MANLGAAITEKASVEIANNTFRHFLMETTPEYIEMVPEYWLEQDQPIREVQITISVLFLLISVIGNTCQVLVIIAYARSVYLFPELKWSALNVQ